MSPARPGATSAGRAGQVFFEVGQRSGRPEVAAPESLASARLGGTFAMWHAALESRWLSPRHDGEAVRAGPDPGFEPARLRRQLAADSAELTPRRDRACVGPRLVVEHRHGARPHHNAPRPSGLRCRPRAGVVPGAGATCTQSGAAWSLAGAPMRTRAGAATTPGARPHATELQPEPRPEGDPFFVGERQQPEWQRLQRVAESVARPVAELGPLRQLRIHRDVDVALHHRRDRQPVSPRRRRPRTCRPGDSVARTTGASRDPVPDLLDRARRVGRDPGRRVAAPLSPERAMDRQPACAAATSPGDSCPSRLERK
jgi:hypothetical protein